MVRKIFSFIPSSFETLTWSRNFIAGHHFIPCECKRNERDETGVECKAFYSNDSQIYTLYDQVDHKLAFLYNFIPPDSELILIGHSVGAFILLEIMSRLQNTKRIIKGVLLFPTIERITKTSSGRFWTTVANYLSCPLLWVVRLFNAFPFRLQLTLVKLCMSIRRFQSDENVLGAILSFLNNHGVSNMLQIAYDMVRIEYLSHETVIKANKDRLVFYYGSDDPWVPASFCEQMIERFPFVDIRQCTQNYKHAFVLHSAENVGKLVWDFISDV